jgi:hypothetical protein
MRFDQMGKHAAKHGNQYRNRLATNTVIHYGVSYTRHTASNRAVHLEKGMRMARQRSPIRWMISANETTALYDHCQRKRKATSVLTDKKQVQGTAIGYLRLCVYHRYTCATFLATQIGYQNERLYVLPTQIVIILRQYLLIHTNIVSPNTTRWQQLQQVCVLASMSLDSPSHQAMK